MPNIGGPKQKIRALLSSVVTSVLTYGIPIWADVLRTQDLRRKIASEYRLSALRVASAFRTVSEDAVCIIAGMLSIEVLSEERRALYQQKGATIPKPEELRKQERRNSIQRWQILWDNTTKGRWTYRLIRQVDAWVNRDHGEVNYYLTQMISGHGCFRAYLHRFKHDVSPEYSYCSGVSEDAEHVFFACPRFQASRSNWESTVHEKLRPESLIKVMLSSKAVFYIFNIYIKKKKKTHTHTNFKEIYGTFRLLNIMNHTIITAIQFSQICF